MNRTTPQTAEQMVAALNASIASPMYQGNALQTQAAELAELINKVRAEERERCAVAAEVPKENPGYEVCQIIANYIRGLK